MDSKAKELAEKHYRLVEEMMKKYGLSEYDVPDWHGALSVGLCVAAKDWSLSTDKDLPAGTFEGFAVPYMMVAVLKEKPLRSVLGKVLAMRDDLNLAQECLLLELCFEEGDEDTINILTAERKAAFSTLLT